MVIRASITGVITSPVVFVSKPRVVRGEIQDSLYSSFSALDERVYFRVYVADPKLLTWMRHNDVREGSTLVIQGRLSIKNYLNKRGAWASSYSISAEKLALAVTVGFTIERQVAGETPVSETATIESTRQLLFNSNVLHQEFTEEFITELRGGNTSQQDRVFVTQFQQHFPADVCGLAPAAVVALAESISAAHRNMLLFRDPRPMNAQILRTVLNNSPVLFDHSRLTASLLTSFIEDMIVAVSESTSSATNDPDTNMLRTRD